ncbi:MAG: MBL fold metallo-hydrolase [Solobacterium sp.]|nr:MBL fold metallo-hydrolase [Solobacterium sp.]
MSLIRSYGHSCFSLTAENGWTAVFDPYKDGSVPGLKLKRITADAVFTSHEHADHNAVGLVRIEKTHECPYEIFTLLTDHDEEQGRLRGKNRITILENAKEKIAHFGDLGRDLTEEEEKKLANADVILIPCGGYYTIDAKLAGEIITRLKPKLAVLMHYRNGAAGYDVLSTLEEVSDIIGNVRCLEESEADTETETGVIALTPLQ